MWAELSSLAQRPPDRVDHAQAERSHRQRRVGGPNGGEDRGAENEAVRMTVDAQLVIDDRRSLVTTHAAGPHDVSGTLRAIPVMDVRGGEPTTSLARESIGLPPPQARTSASSTTISVIRTACSMGCSTVTRRTQSARYRSTPTTSRPTPAASSTTTATTPICSAS